MTMLAEAEVDAIAARHPAVFAGSRRKQTTGWLVSLGVVAYLCFAWWFFAIAAPLAMLGAFLGGKVLDRMSDLNFLKWTRWIVTGLGVIYLIQASQLFAAN